MDEDPQISPEPIFQMMTGFWVSKTLMAAVKLELFTKLGEKKVNLDELSEMLGMEHRPAEVFASALASLGLLETTNWKDPSKGGDHRLFSNSKPSDFFLDKKKPSYMGDIVSMFDNRLYKAWDGLVTSLKTNSPYGVTDGGGEKLFNEAKSNEAIEEMKRFTHAMHGVSVGPAMALPRVFDFSKYRRMMDIGGGSGVYSIHVVKNNPNMTATVIDLEPVCQVATEYIKQSHVQNKIDTRSLDFFKDELPGGYDIAFLSHIIHDYDEDKDVALLKKIHERLSDRGAIIISEWLLNDDKTGPAASALMGLNMIIETVGGRNYSFAEISEMLFKAGFRDVEKRPLVGPAEIVIGHK